MLHHRTHVIGPGHEWVVFVHGAGGSSSIWYPQVRAFRKHFNVLLVDLRGHGGSQGPAQFWGGEPYTFEEVSGDILGVMDHLGIESAHFVGISLGTILIRTLAETAPERVRSMTLGGAIVRLNYRSRFLAWVGNRVKQVVPYMWLYRLCAWIIMPKRRHRESRNLFVGEAKKLCQKEFVRWFRLTCEVTPLLRLFSEREVAVPTLYLMGEEDHMFLPCVRRLAAQHAAHSQLAVVAGAGHVCNVDRAEDFNRTAIAFIQSLAPSRPAALPA